MFFDNFPTKKIGLLRLWVCSFARFTLLWLFFALWKWTLCFWAI
jgi:hypothetical protein